VNLDQNYGQLLFLLCILYRLYKIRISSSGMPVVCNTFFLIIDDILFHSKVVRLQVGIFLKYRVRNFCVLRAIVFGVVSF